MYFSKYLQEKNQPSLLASDQHFRWEINSYSAYCLSYVCSEADSKETEQPAAVSFEWIYVDKDPKLVSSIQVSVVSFACRDILLVY